MKIKSLIRAQIAHRNDERLTREAHKKYEDLLMVDATELAAELQLKFAGGSHRVFQLEEGVFVVNCNGYVEEMGSCARVAELADAQDLKSCGRNPVRVRVPPRALGRRYETT